jgi:tRNA A37 threonylcarbamoyladenosine biosynthesis protein TsaE
MATVDRNEIFDLAYRFITETQESIFLTGKAGTGKTTFLKYLREHSSKNMIVAAPTGVAVYFNCHCIPFCQPKITGRNC